MSVETLAGASNFSSNYQNNYNVTENGNDLPIFGIIVRDTGIGISEESIGKVFDRYYMVKDPQGEQHLVSEIGLALVKNLVLLHKGNNSISSEREVGTDILVIFPVSKNKYLDSDIIKIGEYEIPFMERDSYQIEEITIIESQLAKNSEEYLQRKTNRILLVEDNEELRILIAESLSSQYDICEASNGIIASRLMEKTKIDLIISDLIMPGKDGIALCHEVKDDISTSPYPIYNYDSKRWIGKPY